MIGSNACLYWLPMEGSQMGWPMCRATFDGGSEEFGSWLDLFRSSGGA